LRRALTIGVVCLAAALAGCGDDKGDESTDQASTATTTEQTAPATTETQTQTEASGECKRVSTPKAEKRKGKKPRGELDEGRDYKLVFATSCGKFTIALDLKAAPKASASLVSLAESGYFDGTSFHRIVPGFVIQGGDPTASGQGGPGYSTVDKPPSDASYGKGVVAMAKTETEAPGTAGSQFFVVTGDDAGLPPDYAVVGKVTDGLDVVELIGQQGGPDEQPIQPVVIERVTVEK
jgi:cyclophilin family peptidyl-prolyl cis-trans isomerase